MLMTSSQLTHFGIHATDGDIGGCKDLLFDDQDYIIRYLIADTNTWLPLSRKVLISPIAVAELDMTQHKVHINMTRERLKDSPDIDEHKPVSREYEETLFKYFGYGYYWIGPGAWGDFAHPLELADTPEDDSKPTEVNKENHLRSCNELIGYDIAASDEVMGHLCDFIIERSSWSIRYAIIDTRNWFPGGRKVVIGVNHIVQADWSSHQVKLNISADEIRESPEIEIERLTQPTYAEELKRTVIP